jgi:exopolysaccharide production protein ExoQ
VSSWFGADIINANGVREDTFLDKGLFLVLILAGLSVLLIRRVNWGNIISANKWLFLFFLYLGISVLWSDQSLVAFKRWFKDFGNIIMVLIVISEKNPAQAVKQLLARLVYLIIPLSVMLIKYYPALSTKYSIWTYEKVFTGLATDKNGLGMTLLAPSLLLFWMLLQLLDGTAQRGQRKALFRYSILLIMTVWILHLSNSSTAVACTVLGGCLLIALKVPAIRNKVNRLGTYTLVFAVLVVFLQTIGVWTLFMESATSALGRDPSLHGRSAIWRAVLAEDVNPFIGAGFYSFWSAQRNQRLSQNGGYFYLLGEAHNGYIETYLNSGLVGLALLIAAIVSSVKGIKRDVLNGSPLGDLRLAFLISILTYAVSESIFDRSTLWFILLLVMTERQYRPARYFPQFGLVRRVEEGTLRGRTTLSVSGVSGLVTDLRTVSAEPRRHGFQATLKPLPHSQREP